MGCTTVKEIKEIPKDKVLIEIRTFKLELLENILFKKDDIPTSGSDLYNLICEKSKLVKSKSYMLLPLERTTLFRNSGSKVERIRLFSPERIILENQKYFVMVSVPGVRPLIFIC